LDRGIRRGEQRQHGVRDLHQLMTATGCTVRARQILAGSFGAQLPAFASRDASCTHSEVRFGVSDRASNRDTQVLTSDP
jgi:hypothetical protein